MLIMACAFSPDVISYFLMIYFTLFTVLYIKVPVFLYCFACHSDAEYDLNVIFDIQRICLMFGVVIKHVYAYYGLRVFT